MLCIGYWLMVIYVRTLALFKVTIHGKRHMKNNVPMGACIPHRYIDVSCTVCPFIYSTLHLFFLLFIIITSLAKEVMFLVVLVCLSVCLSVCGQHYSKSYERIGMTFYGGVLGSKMKNWLNFGGNLGILKWVNEQKNTKIVVAYPDRGAGNDPKLVFFWGGGG